MSNAETHIKSTEKTRESAVYTAETRQWLNLRFNQFDADGKYIPNQSSYGFSALAFRLEEYARMYAVLHCLDRMTFGNVLDTGCADGYGPALIRKLYQVPVTGMDLSDRALVRSREMYRFSGACGDIHRLPFPDKAFDVVISTEVLEHVTDPGQAIAELMRVGRKFVILTTPRAKDVQAEMQHRETIDPGEPHAHIHCFSAETLKQYIQRPAFYKGARTRFVAKLLDSLAWGDETTRVQRQSYLDFTLKTSNLNEQSRHAIQHALINRYTDPPKWKKTIGQPHIIGFLLRLDVFLATRFPAMADDHLTIIPISDVPLHKHPSLGARKILSALLNDFRVQPLRNRQS